MSRISLAVVSALLVAGCNNSPRSGPPIGQAFAGPAILNIRSDIPTQSPTVVTVKHGDRLEILDRRRSFVKVRAANGVEGWTDDRQLLASGDMAGLRKLDELAAKLVSQGRATNDAELRVHMQPSTKSPSLVTLKPDEKVDVLTHITRPRTDIPRQPLIPPPPKKQVVAKKASKKDATAVPPPPMPKAPAPPANWLDLSKPNAPRPTVAPAPAVPVPTDDWSLVRTAGGQCGWVLTRLIRMAVPDEVGQYAEGHRVVSYFSLGSVQDGDQKKDIWLWTTLSGGQQPYDFDSLRVFVWSAHRHRYETQHIEKNLRGHGPVLLGLVKLTTFRGKSAVSTESYPGFSACVEKSDGNRYRRSYALVNTSIRFAGEEACEAQPPLEIGPDQNMVPAAPSTEPPPPGLMQRMKKRVKSIFGH